MSSDKNQPQPATPDQKPQAPNPGGSNPPPTNPLDEIRDTILDDTGNFTRIDIPVTFPGVSPPAGTKLD